MADTNRSETYALILRLTEKPYSFDFFQAARRLDCTNPTGDGIGATGRLGDDPVRFGQRASMAFAPSTIASFTQGKGESPHRMAVNFFGLLGPNGPMPLHITEYVHEREHNFHDRTLARFLDVFHHRMIAMFYRAWAVNQAAASFDRMRYDPLSDRIGNYVASLAGYGSPSLRGRDRVDDLAKLHYVGHLSSHTKNAGGLEAIVSDFFRVPTQVIEFVGHWMDLPADSVCKLGESRQTGLLGTTAVVGSRIWEVQQKFRIRIGPVPLKVYLRFLPTGTSFGKLVDWVRNYVGHEYRWDAQLVLRREDAPRTMLGATGQLGWTTWLSTSLPEHDPDDLVLEGAN